MMFPKPKNEKYESYTHVKPAHLISCMIIVDPQGFKIINSDETFKVHVKKFHIPNHEKFPENQLKIEKILNFLKKLKNLKYTEK